MLIFFIQKILKYFRNNVSSSHMRNESHNKIHTLRPTLHIKREGITPKLLNKYTFCLLFLFSHLFLPLQFSNHSFQSQIPMHSPLYQSLYNFSFLFSFFLVFCQLFVNAPLKFSNHSFRSQIPMHFPLYYSLYNFFFFFCFANFLLMHHSKYIKYVKINLII